MAVVEHRRGPVGLEAAIWPASAGVLANWLQTRRINLKKHAPRAVGLRQQHLIAGHDRAGSDDAEEFVGPPAKVGLDGACGRINHQEPVSHPGQEAVATTDGRAHGRAVACQLVARPPAFPAGGQIEGHQSAVEALHEVEPFRRRRRGARRAAADLHDDQPLLPDVDHQRRGADAEKVPHHVIRLGCVNLPAARAVGQAAAFEPSLGAKRDHGISGDHRGRPRSTVVAEGVDVVGGIPLLPEFTSRFGLEAADPDLLGDAVADHAPSLGYCGTAVALSEFAVPDDAWAVRRPRHSHAFQAAASVGRGAEECAPVLSGPGPEIGHTAGQVLLHWRRSGLAGGSMARTQRHGRHRDERQSIQHRFRHRRNPSVEHRKYYHSPMRSNLWPRKRKSASVRC